MKLISCTLNNYRSFSIDACILQGPGPQVYPRRLAPYPSPAMHMTQKRQQQGYPNPGPGPQMQPGFSPAGGPQVQSLLVSVTYSILIIYRLFLFLNLLLCPVLTN